MENLSAQQGALIEMICFQVNIVEVTVEIPQKWHTSMIGTKGHLIREISEDCGGVLIRFPTENTQSDKVYIRGVKDEVEKARKRLLEVASDKVCKLFEFTDFILCVL